MDFLGEWIYRGINIKGGLRFANPSYKNKIEVSP